MNFKTKIFLSTFFIISVAITTPKATAAEIDENIIVKADNAKIYNNADNIEFFGNVNIKKGSLTIDTAKIKISKNKSGDYFTNATGGFRISDNINSIKGLSKSCNYNTVDNIITMIDEAKIQNKEIKLEGEVIKYNVTKKLFTVDRKSPQNFDDSLDIRQKNRPIIIYHEK